MSIAVGAVVVSDMAVAALLVCLGMAVVAVTCCTSTAGLDSSVAGVVSVSQFSNEARKSVMAFRTPLGNGPNCISAQSHSKQMSLASIFSTVFMSSLVGAGGRAGSV